MLIECLIGLVRITLLLGNHTTIPTKQKKTYYVEINYMYVLVYNSITESHICNHRRAYAAKSYCYDQNFVLINENYNYNKNYTNKNNEYPYFHQ